MDSPKDVAFSRLLGTGGVLAEGGSLQNNFLAILPAQGKEVSHDFQPTGGALQRGRGDQLKGRIQSLV